MARPRGPRRDYTYEEYLEIKKENKRKLEEIMTTPDYMEVLGRKYYGERWFTALPDGHEKREQRRKDLVSGKIQFTPYTDREIVQLDSDGNFIEEWESARVWAEETMEEERRFSAAQHIVKVAKGEGESAYGFRWKFKEDYE